MVELKNRVDLFAAPYFKYKVDGADGLNKELYEHILKLQGTDEGIKASNSEFSWHSSRDFLSSQAECIQKLKTEISSAISITISNLNPQFDFEGRSVVLQCWANSNSQGGYNALHDHGDFLLSGVYYVMVPVSQSERSGMIEFVNVRNDHELCSVIGTPTFEKKVATLPEAGDMIVFPATLPHSVYPNSTDERRVSIAWNMKFK